MLTIHFTEEKPLYEQIVDHIIQEIATENLASRERLPSRRQLAEHLGVSLNTVIKAYQQLLDEGYIVSRERSGYYVDQLEAEMLRQEKPQSERATIPVPPVPAYRYDFSPFAKRPQVMKEGLLRRSMGEALPQALAIGRVPSGGYGLLRAAIAQDLWRYRGLPCEPGQVIITNGYQSSLQALFSLLVKPAMALEEPGYPRACQVLRDLHIPFQALPLDRYGFSVRALEESTANGVLTMPNLQFPTTQIMGVRRRQRLLNWAYERPERFIIEDDYNSEFRFTGRPIPPLMALDQNERVILLGSYTQSLGPLLKISYMVLPKPLAKCFKKDGHVMGQASIFDQCWLATMLRSGCFSKHLQRLRTHYRQVGQALIKAIKNSTLPVEIFGEGRGLYFILNVHFPNVTVAAVLQQAKKRGLNLAWLGTYQQDLTQTDLRFVLGFAGLGREEVGAAWAELEAAFQAARSA